MFMFNASFPFTFTREVSVYQTVCLEDLLLCHNKTVHPEQAVDKAGPQYKRVWSWKDHALLVFFLGPFSSAKTFLSLLPSFIFAHRLPTSKVLIAEGGPPSQKRSSGNH